MDKELEQKLNLQIHKYFWGYIDNTFPSIREAERLLGVEPNRLHILKNQKNRFYSTTLFQYFNTLGIDIIPLQEQIKQIIEEHHV